MRAVLLLDLERFKFVNDTLGYEIDDSLLKTAGRRLMHGVRTGDRAATSCRATCPAERRHPPRFQPRISAKPHDVSRRCFRSELPRSKVALSRDSRK